MDSRGPTGALTLSKRRCAPMRKRWLFIPLFLLLVPLVGALGGQLLAILLSFISAMKPSGWTR
jgi:hypothetical protein